MPLRSLMTLLVSTVIAVGCGSEGKDEIERVVVKGKVTREGKPISKGTITFFPTKGTNGPVSGAPINNGEYTVDTKGGVPVGTHIVQFHQVEATPEVAGRPIPQAENNVLPPKFNEQSKLEFTVGAENATDGIVKDFDLDKEFGDAAN